MADFFREAQSLVSAQDAARHYGLTFSRKGWALCPFHPDKHPSMSFHKGRFRCWSCGAAGDSIDLTSHLFNLTPLEAARKLDADFHLSLPLDKPVTPQDRRKAQVEADRREAVTSVWTAWERWKDETIRDLCECARLANTTEKYMSAPSELSDLAAECLRKREWAEHMVEMLEGGDLDEQIAIWKNREGVRQWSERILNQN